MNDINATNQAVFIPRRLIEDYTLFWSTISFCQGVRIGQRIMAPEVVSMQIFNLSSTKYKLKAPVNITLEKYADEVLALLPDLTLCGEGLSVQEAIEDLKADILDLLDDLEDIPESDLGMAPKLWKQSLDLMVEECQ